MTRVITVIAIVLMVALAGCQRTLDRTGSGAVRLSDEALARLVGYLTTPRPLGYAITMDGSAGSGSFCAFTDPRFCGQYRDMDAVFTCEARHNQPCQLFARGREIVWRGGGDWAGDGPLARFVTTAVSIPPSDTLVQIEGGGRLSYGFAYPTDDLSRSILSVIVEGNGLCAGEAALPDDAEGGSWGLVCRDNTIFRGALPPGPARDGVLSGTGVGSRGEPVRITLRTSGTPE